MFLFDTLGAWLLLDWTLKTQMPQTIALPTPCLREQLLLGACTLAAVPRLRGPLVCHYLLAQNGGGWRWQAAFYLGCWLWGARLTYHHDLWESNHLWCETYP